MNRQPPTLLLDVGNSRLKWALHRNGRIGGQKVIELGGGSGTASFRELAAQARTAGTVLAVSVAGRVRDAALARTLGAAGLPRPRFIRSSRTAAGVTNGYTDSWRLGADRWVLAIAAWHEAGRSRPVCVISVGTALTIDVVDAAGRHQGGLIAPAADLMRRALLLGTRGIAVRSRGTASRRLRLFATDTRSAVESGSLLACAALIDRVVGEARASYGRGTRVYLTGGGAAALRPLLRSAVVAVPDLVLRGLAVLAAESGAALLR